MTNVTLTTSIGEGGGERNRSSSFNAKIIIHSQGIIVKDRPGRIRTSDQTIMSRLQISPPTSSGSNPSHPVLFATTTKPSGPGIVMSPRSPGWSIPIRWEAGAG